MTSRREFLSNAFGIALASATTWPIRADQARSTQGQSNTGASKSGRTAQKTTLGWDVFLAPSIPAITSDGSCVRIALLGWDHGTSPATEGRPRFLYRWRRTRAASVTWELFGNLMPCTLLMQRRRYFEVPDDSCRLWPPS